MRSVIIDLETRSTVDLTDVGAHVYAAHPSTDVLCCGYAVDDGDVKIWRPGDPIPDEIIAAADDPDTRFIAFSANFERQIWQQVLVPRYGWPAAPISKWCCLQARVLSFALPASLKDVADALELAHRKGHDSAMLKLCKPRKPRKGEDPNNVYWHNDPADLEALYLYCIDDVECERELNTLLPTLSPEEQRLWELDQRVNDRGVAVDGELLAGALAITAMADAEIEHELTTITSGEITSVGQIDRIMTWLGAHNCVVDCLDKKAVSAVLRRVDLAPEARRVLELRRAGAHTSTKKLKTMAAWRGIDGRVRGALRFHGAATGRWSSLGAQLHNLKRPTITDLDTAIALVTAGNFEAVKNRYERPLEIVGNISRAILVAAPGKTLLIGDYSGVESRLTAWIAGQQSKLDQWSKFDETGELVDHPYYRFGVDHLKLAPEIAYDLGKRCDLAFGFGGGVNAWRRMAPEGDTATDVEIDLRKLAWRAAHPKVKQYWWTLEHAAVTAFQNPGKIRGASRIRFVYKPPFLFAILPSGRGIAYPFPAMMVNRFGNFALTFLDNSNGKWAPCNKGQGTYGGALLENVVQGAARDLLGAAMTRLEDAGYPIVLHAHDEIVCEMPLNSGSADQLKRMMAAPSKARIGTRFTGNGVS
jgi:DNA polymerase